MEILKRALISACTQSSAKGQESWPGSYPELYQPCGHLPDVATNHPRVSHRGQVGPLSQKGRETQGKCTRPKTDSWAGPVWGLFEKQSRRVGAQTLAFLRRGKGIDSDRHGGEGGPQEGRDGGPE